MCWGFLGIFRMSFANYTVSVSGDKMVVRLDYQNNENPDDQLKDELCKQTVAMDTAYLSVSNYRDIFTEVPHHPCI